MLTLEKTVSSPASATMPKPRLDMFKQDGYEQGTCGDITLRLLRKLTRLLGRYSLKNEGRLAHDIIQLIEHDIKKNAENDLMRRPYRNQLDTQGTGRVYQEIYLATKNIMLEFGSLMKEGSVEHQARIEHKDTDVIKEMEKEASIVWMLNIELRRMEILLSNDRFYHMINIELHDELSKYIRILKEDLKMFEKAHDLKPLHQRINPDATTTSSE